MIMVYSLLLKTKIESWEQIRPFKFPSEEKPDKSILIFTRKHPKEIIREMNKVVCLILLTPSVFMVAKSWTVLKCPKIEEWLTNPGPSQAMAYLEIIKITL